MFNIEELIFLLGRYQNEDPKVLKHELALAMQKPENKHIQSLMTYAYKFLQVMVKDNHHIGLYLAKWMSLFFIQVRIFFCLFINILSDAFHC